MAQSWNLSIIYFVIEAFFLFRKLFSLNYFITFCEHVEDLTFKYMPEKLLENTSNLR